MAATAGEKSNSAIGASAGAGPASTNSLVKRISENVFELGKVRLDKKRRTVAFPATVNIKDSLIEYLVVTDNGKTHESLLRTEAEPYQIHTAMLLLGAKGANTNGSPKPENPVLSGEKVALEIGWKHRRKAKRYPAEYLVFNRRTRSAMASGVWIYNGSRIGEGMFVAQRDGSVVSLITDPDALVNNSGADREDDENWLPYAKRLPAVNSAVQVTIKLLR